MYVEIVDQKEKKAESLYFYSRIFHKLEQFLLKTIITIFCFSRVAIVAVVTMLIGVVAIKSVVYCKSLTPSLLFCRTQ